MIPGCEHERYVTECKICSAPKPTPPPSSEDWAEKEAKWNYYRVQTAPDKESAIGEIKAALLSAREAQKKEDTALLRECLAKMTPECFHRELPCGACDNCKTTRRFLSLVPKLTARLNNDKGESV